MRLLTVGLSMASVQLAACAQPPDGLSLEFSPLSYLSPSLVTAACARVPTMERRPPELSEALLAKAETRPSLARSAALLIGLILLFTLAVSFVLVLLPDLAVLGLLAYSFGCRHGVDADHIAAIDNVTRRMVASGRRPITVGIFFSIGHCTVVLLLCVFVMLSAGAATGAQLESFARAGASIGPWVAACVLLTIGAINLLAARDFLVQWRERQATGHEHEIATLVTRCCPSLIEAIDKPWKVVWIGLLFGLGLDTATEIALLTMSALAQTAVPPLCALVLPLLFAAGMALVDSLNALLMVWAYEWASENGPMFRLFFSAFLTVASALLALSIGAIEGLGQLVDTFPDTLRGVPFWDAMSYLSSHLELLGVASVAVFLIAITCAVLFAHRCVPSKAQIEEETRVRVSKELQRYMQRGEYIVRFE